jgi:hypothetical protein
MPQIDMRTGALRFVDEAESHTYGAPSGSAHAIACWLHRDLIVEALTAGLDKEIEGAIPAAERPAREAALRKQLLELERVECALIERSGGDAHYRADCSPMAILGIEAAPPETMEQAA